MRRAPKESTALPIVTDRVAENLQAPYNFQKKRSLWGGADHSDSDEPSNLSPPPLDRREDGAGPRITQPLTFHASLPHVVNFESKKRKGFCEMKGSEGNVRK
jgi:hypothetical protein